MSLGTRSLTPKPIRRGMFSDFPSSPRLANLSPIKTSRNSRSPRFTHKSFEVTLAIEKSIQSDSLEIYKRQDEEIQNLRATVRKLTQMSIKEANFRKVHEDCAYNQAKLSAEVVRLHRIIAGTKQQFTQTQLERRQLVQGQRELAAEFIRQQGALENIVRGFKALTGSLLDNCAAQMNENQQQMALEAMKEIEAAGVSMQAEAYQISQSSHTPGRRLPDVPHFRFESEHAVAERSLKRCDSVTDIEPFMESPTDSPVKHKSRLGVVLYDYSPSTLGELSASRGDILTVLEQMDGWVEAFSSSGSGRFPTKLLHML